MGSIYKRGRILWIAYYHHGKQHHESSKSEDRRAAEKLLLQREIEAEQEKLPNVKAEKTKFKELAQDLLQHYSLHNKRSLKWAKVVTKRLIDCFGSYKAHDISTNLINRHIEKRKEEGIADATINRELALLKRAYNLGMQQTPPRVLRMPHFKKIRENNVRKGFFENNEFLALRSVLPTHLKALVTLAYYTGMRKGEIVGLRWDQVDLTEGIIRLEQEDTKNAQPRAIYLNDEVFRLLVGQRRERDLTYPTMPFVFYTPKGEPIDEFRRSWKTACKKVGLQGRLFHDFRRTAIRNMVRSGTPERVSMMISGHKTRSVFERYNIVNEEDLRLAAKRVETYISTKREAEDPYKELEAAEVKSFEG